MECLSIHWDLEFLWPMFYSFLIFVFYGTEFWTQGLHLEPLCQPFVVTCFRDRFSQMICPGCLRTMILLIYASCVARITGVSHQPLVVLLFYLFWSFHFVCVWEGGGCLTKLLRLALNSHLHLLSSWISSDPSFIYLFICSARVWTPPAPFFDGFCRDRVLRTTCLDWLRTMILLISASWVGRITGVSHHPWHLCSFLMPLWIELFSQFHFFQLFIEM
jgi:hypothetical protein